jgi:hypothetical protein
VVDLAQEIFLQVQVLVVLVVLVAVVAQPLVALEAQEELEAKEVTAAMVQHGQAVVAVAQLPLEQQQVLVHL